VSNDHRPADARLELALDLARLGGRHALAGRAGARVAWKGPGERVTDVDIAIESRLVGNIRAGFPEDGIVAEERLAADPGDREFVWVLDPLDGTNNYALDIPCYAVSIGILKSGLPYAGVVHDPNTGFTCWARRGYGAFCGERRLRLESRRLSVASNIAPRVPLDGRLAPLIVDWLSRFKFRGFGSVALHLAYAAIGALDLVLDHKATLWDIAGGATVLLEAGGCLTDPGGQPLFPVDPAAYRGAPVPFLAGNPAAHAEALACCHITLATVGERAR
jgi:myo-inositol-1(or 4)-monophosphatase